MINLTATMAANGELFVRALSEKAQKGYNGTDPMIVYEYEGEHGKTYAIKDADGIHRDLSAEQVEETLESLVFDDEDDDDDEDDE